MQKLKIKFFHIALFLLMLSNDLAAQNSIFWFSKTRLSLEEYKIIRNEVHDLVGVIFEMDPWCYGSYEKNYKNGKIGVKIIEYFSNKNDSVVFAKVDYWYNTYAKGDSQVWTYFVDGAGDTCEFSKFNYFIFDRSLPIGQQVIIFYGNLIFDEEKLNRVKRSYPQFENQINAIVEKKELEENRPLNEKREKVNISEKKKCWFRSFLKK